MGEVIRLEVEASVDKKLLRFLKDELKVAEEDIFQISGPIDLTFLMKMYGLSGCDSLRYEPYKRSACRRLSRGRMIFEAIRGGDILLHHPYETFDPVVDFIRQAASDPDVLASSRRSTVSAAIHRLSHLSRRRRRTENRCRCSWS